MIYVTVSIAEINLTQMKKLRKYIQKKLINNNYSGVTPRNSFTTRAISNL